MQDRNKGVAGIDTGKDWLDIAIVGGPEQFRVGNGSAGWQQAGAHLLSAGVGQVGIEASGGYERGVVAALRAEGLEVVLCQPVQVRLFARLQLQHAKTDRLDAALIAAFTARHGAARPAPDPRRDQWAGHLGYIEQLTQDIARLKTRLEQQHEPRLRQHLTDDIKTLSRRREAERQNLAAQLRADAELARRLDLLLSIPGIGLPTALALMVHMPELGRLSRQQATALAGLAPFARDSGRHNGAPHIAGGRAQLRTALYAAALPAAFRWNPAIVSLYRRLTANGKPHKLALVACARKLLIFANKVIERATPWLTSQAKS